jgi:hypothetical protein
MKAERTPGCRNVTLHILNLLLTRDRLAVCQLLPSAPVPAWAENQQGFCSITRTNEELSIVCPEGVVPAGVKQEAGWRMFKVEGPLDFGLTGVLAAIAAPLAQAGISIFTLATFNTDYVLVKDAKVGEAMKALQAAGHTAE